MEVHIPTVGLAAWTTKETRFLGRFKERFWSKKNERFRELIDGVLPSVSDDSNSVVEEVAIAMVHTKTIPCPCALSISFSIFLFPLVFVWLRLEQGGLDKVPTCNHKCGWVMH